MENPLGSKELVAGSSLGEVLDFSDGLTRERNKTYFPTLDKRINHLYRSGVEMFDTVRSREKNAEFIPLVASKILLRTVNVLQALSLDRDAVIDKLKEKYPESGCSYCGKKPCKCGVIRSEDKVGAVSSLKQRKWTIADWQKHLDLVYGDSNRARGFEWVATRIGSEIGELDDASTLMERYAKTDPQKAEEYRKEAASEAADVFAWAIGICNVAGVDLEKAFVERFGKGCPNCGKYPCRCGEFSGVQERKALKAM